MMDRNELADRLETATVAARTATREAHEAVQALRAATREARKVRDEVLADIRKAMAAEVQVQVDELGEATQKAIATAVDRVFAQFDRLADSLLSGDGGEHLERLAKNWRARAERGRERERDPVPRFWAGKGQD